MEYGGDGLGHYGLDRSPLEDGEDMMKRFCRRDMMVREMVALVGWLLSEIKWLGYLYSEI